MAVPFAILWCLILSRTPQTHWTFCPGTLFICQHHSWICPALPVSCLWNTSPCPPMGYPTSIAYASWCLSGTRDFWEEICKLCHNITVSYSGTAGWSGNPRALLPTAVSWCLTAMTSWSWQFSQSCDNHCTLADLLSNNSCETWLCTCKCAFMLWHAHKLLYIVVFSVLCAAQCIYGSYHFTCKGWHLHGVILCYLWMWAKEPSLQSQQQLVHRRVLRITHFKSTAV